MGQRQGSPLAVTDFLASIVPVPTDVRSLRRFADLLAITCRGMSTVDQVVGMPSPDRPDPFFDTSAAEMLPTGVRTVSITGVLDDNWPSYVAADWVDAARAAIPLARSQQEICPAQDIAP